MLRTPRGLRELSLTALLLLDDVAILVLQAALQEPRPAESCLPSCGLPSGHAVICISLTCWLSCELVARQKGLRRWGGVLLVVAIHVPVTWAKVHLMDHTPLQVFSGAVLGAILGFGHFALLQRCYPHLSSSAWLVDNYGAKASGPDGYRSLSPEG
ncbi:unnamed protein product [Durusdinium trenchii]